MQREDEGPCDFLSHIPFTIMPEQATQTRASISAPNIRVWLHFRETICSHEDGIYAAPYIIRIVPEANAAEHNLYQRARLRWYTKLIPA
jgi:hypothetical protein